MKARVIVTVALALVVSIGPAQARAFCGFYVSGADESLYNAATMIVLMRDGRRTVLSMQNDYRGPPADFALVVPVPEVLEEENVRTLPREIFDRVDRLAAPRLVEYWEQDPCNPRPRIPLRRFRGRSGGTGSGYGSGSAGLGVVVEAEFSVGEYDIVILSASDSSGLDTWLRGNDYNIPEGAEPVLRPYVAAGTKFFVAKVAVERVTFEDGKAVLSPLRFYYDTDELSLPVRLGLLNSAGKQDLIVHILARNQRYEVANYANAFIPTNIRVDDAVRHDFGAFYDLLFRRTVAANPGSIVTEYAWAAGSCDPCPVSALTPSELATLGADVVSPSSGGSPVRRGRGGRAMGGLGGGWVLTRLHHRYSSDELSEDLVFRAAPAVVGGRGMPDREGQLSERGATEASMNNFQGRYAILHPFEGEVACESPQRGLWGGPPGESSPSVIGAMNPALNPATLAQAEDAPEDTPRVTALGPVVKEAITALRIQPGVVEGALPADPGPPHGAEMPEPSAGQGTEAPQPTEAQPTVTPETPSPAAQSDDGCGCAAHGPPPASLWPLAVVLFFVTRRRRRQTPPGSP